MPDPPGSSGMRKLTLNSQSVDVLRFAALAQETVCTVARLTTRGKVAIMALNAPQPRFAIIVLRERASGQATPGSQLHALGVIRPS